MIRNLIDIASKGGNYLLNIGPRGDGTVPMQSVDALKAIGAWMKVNSEAIYGTTASPFPKLEWGRATTKGNTLYLHVFDWPSDGILDLPMKADVVKASLLADPTTKLTVAGTGENTRLTLPKSAPDPTATVIRIELRGAPVVTGD
jgi:alpha-L-fucosidase